MKVPALNKAREDLNHFIGSWNGEDTKFIHEGAIYHEDDVNCATEALEKIEELQELLAELNI